jgi:transcriptional regulator of arginine metabolism
MTKPTRQRTILELLGNGTAITSQEELQRALGKRGFKVGQATLSRDIRELGVIKTARGYVVPGKEVVAEPALPSVSHLVREFVLDVRPAQNLLVIKTAVGSAQPVAAALDGESWPEVVGTIAGDDAILIVSPDKKATGKLAERIRGILAR